ncbi:MAG: membrane integrity-associated transporter subunit PqiC [Rudaea sp.]|uniref:ABC-type transport auxiliary lipoprotein family protein n=1 Tax=unclassified Rudaea TaxID=2627037 RepID=UPI0010F76FC9|nr:MULTISPECIES: ABC-type transport auxiliary lipoprotein family protein [unclassified Rudaea]MBN8885956.1 membrane integrity-associated transporter subunit PqiC [Rudaea sp.]MBR0347040.1 membrane integrity-associated transporter subunit PqiC [Rudaea sp.]
MKRVPRIAPISSPVRAKTKAHGYAAARWTATTLCTLMLAACSPPTVPDVTYFRLPPAAKVERLPKPLSVLPIEVETFRAEGVYAEQAVLYATTPDAGALRAYHYQLWSDPPSRTLQERLTLRLRETGIAPLVTDRLPASVQALHVKGRIRRYERVQQAQGVIAQVEFEMRVEQDSGEPLLEQSYSAEQAAANDTMSATAQAFATAVDAVFAKFQTDFIALEGGKP